jgi:hypothetical protein
MENGSTHIAGRHLTVTNPANNKLITKVTKCGAKETKKQFNPQKLLSNYG